MNLELVYSDRLIFFLFYGGFPLRDTFTRGPNTFLRSFNIGIKPSCFLECLSLEFLYFYLNYTIFFL